MPIGIDMNNFDISMGTGMLRVGRGGGLAGNVFINGNVGINTTNPIYPLDVSGVCRIGPRLEMRAPGETGTRSVYIDSTPTDLFILNQRNGPFIFGTNNAERMRITSTGSVGIGTGTPVAALDVSGQIKTNRGVVFGSGGDFQIKKSDTSKILLISHFSNPSSDICFVNEFSNGKTHVGIDTPNPIYPLDVSGVCRIGQRLEMRAPGETGTRSMYIDSTLTDLFILNQRNGPFIFGTNNAERMRITSTGYVGIGTTTPTAALDVSGGISITQTGINSFAQLIRNTTGEGAGWNSRLSIVPYLGNNGYNNLSTLGDVGIIWGAPSGTNGNLFIGAHSTTAGGIKITTTGNVGIGTNNPTVALDVNGVIRTTNITASTGTTSGALRVAGGAGIAGALYTGGEIVSYGNNISCLTTTNGGARLVTGYLFGGSSYSGYLEFFTANGTRLGYFGNVENVSNVGTGHIHLSLNNGTLGLYIVGTDTDSTDTTTGQLKLTGGAGIAKSLTVGSNFVCGGSNGTTTPFTSFTSKRFIIASLGFNNAFRITTVGNDGAIYLEVLVMGSYPNMSAICLKYELAVAPGGLGTNAVYSGGAAVTSGNNVPISLNIINTTGFLLRQTTTSKVTTFAVYTPTGGSGYSVYVRTLAGGGDSNTATTVTML